MVDRNRPFQLNNLFPFAPYITNQENKTDNKSNVIQNIFPGYFVFKKTIPEVNPYQYICHHPDNDHSNCIYDQYKKPFYIIFRTHVASYFILSISKEALSPLNTLKSTKGAMPLTWPLSLCCQKIQFLLIRGLSFTR